MQRYEKIRTCANKSDTGLPVDTHYTLKVVCLMRTRAMGRAYIPYYNYRVRGLEDEDETCIKNLEKEHAYITKFIQANI